MKKEYDFYFMASFKFEIHWGNQWLMTNEFYYKWRRTGKNGDN